MTDSTSIPHESHPPAHGDEPGGAHAGEHLRALFVIFGVLMVLLVLTVAVAFVHMGVFNIVVAMAIAATKATLVVLYFMHVKQSGRLIWVASAAAFLWLGILIAMTMGDYLSRDRISRGDLYPTETPFRHPVAVEQK